MDGILLYDDTKNCFAVQQLIDGVITDESAVRELHCGECLMIQVKYDDWRATRMEKDGNDVWYLANVGRAASMIGHSVKILKK